MTFVYLDTETTSLDPNKGQVWELAYAIDDGKIMSAFVPHSLDNAEPAALRVGKYLDRAPDRWDTKSLIENNYFIDAARRALVGATVVGANPAFDTAFLREIWGRAPWHHRLLDIETYAMPAFGWDKPRGLKDVAWACRDVGADIPEPDHTAAGDVATVRACHLALSSHYLALSKGPF